MKYKINPQKLDKFIIKTPPPSINHVTNVTTTKFNEIPTLGDESSNVDLKAFTISSKKLNSNIIAINENESLLKNKNSYKRTIDELWKERNEKNLIELMNKVKEDEMIIVEKGNRFENLKMQQPVYKIGNFIYKCS